jgi:hypothetical protein
MGEPLRRYVERELNQCLKGNAVQIGGLDVRPFRLSVEVRDAVIALSAHLDPSLIPMPRLWTGLRGRLFRRLGASADDHLGGGFGDFRECLHSRHFAGI